MVKRRISFYTLKNILKNGEARKLRVAVIIFSFSFLFAILTTQSIIFLTSKLPDREFLKEYKPDQTTQIFDVNDKLIANIHGDEDRVLVPLNKISPYILKAVISIEDNRFYEHNGIDVIGTFRAMVKNFVGDEDTKQGGSTLTQQLAKNSFLSPERSIRRKLAEAVIALRLETIFSKDKILEMYLNRIYWGNRAYGIEKAAKRYFKKSAKDLNLAQSAMLAGLIKAPEGYSPFYNYKMTKIRQKIVLERMEHYGYITQKQKLEAEKEKLKIYPPNYSYSKYPYFIDYVSYLIRKNYGNEILRRGGLKVYTTLDPKVQELAEKTIKDGIKELEGFTGVKQGALVSIDVKNGYIQGLVGGRNFAKSNYNRAIFSKRAAGSSFKPVVYLTAFRLGVVKPDSIVLDAPISFNTGWNIWSPHNWDGKYMGRLTVRQALTLSRNTTTVRVSLKVGIDSIIQTARLLGIKSSIDRNFSIVLGSLGISPLEMATAFSTLARDGSYIEPIAIRKIVDHQGDIIEENTTSPVQVVSHKFVKQLNSILVDVVEKGTGKAAKLSDRQVAGKTGTTDNVRDIWFTGFTPDTVTTIWLGNDQNLPLNGVFSSNCAELWGRFSKQYYKLKQIPAQSITGKNNLTLKTDQNKKKPLNKNSDSAKENNNKKKTNKNIQVNPQEKKKEIPESAKNIKKVVIKPKPLPKTPEKEVITQNSRLTPSETINKENKTYANKQENLPQDNQRGKLKLRPKIVQPNYGTNQNE